VRTLLRLVLLAVLCVACIGNETLGSALDARLDDGWYSWQVDTPRAHRESLQIYVLLESGTPVRLQFDDAGCPAKDRPATATDLGTIAPDASIEWLRPFIEPRSRISSAVMAAVYAHASERSVAVLAELVTPGHDIETRREALFWLAQSDSGRAFAILDGLLSDRG
jgi:hypothetical protein